MFRLIVFDLDGTLVDSRRDIAESANALLVACGAEPLSEATIGRMVGDGAATLVARAFAASGVPTPDDALERFLALYAERLLRHTRPYPGIPDVLDALSARASLAVLTNKPLHATREVLAGLDLIRFFSDDAILGGDGRFPRKPDPAGLTFLAARIGAPAQAAVLVGDSFIDWQTARNASTCVCVARYGFGFEGFPQHTLAPHGLVVDQPLDLLTIL